MLWLYLEPRQAMGWTTRAFNQIVHASEKLNSQSNAIREAIRQQEDLFRVSQVSTKSLVIDLTKAPSNMVCTISASAIPQQKSVRNIPSQRCQWPQKYSASSAEYL